MTVTIALRASMIVFVACAVAGCFPCATRHIADQNGTWHRISPRLLAEYGCGSFTRVVDAHDMVEWCTARGLGDGIAADAVPGCRPGETPGGCELFWVCE